jgi:hypothetical protein
LLVLLVLALFFFVALDDIEGVCCTSFGDVTDTSWVGAGVGGSDGGENRGAADGDVESDERCR